MGDKDIISVSEVSEVTEVTEDEVPLTPITDNFSNLDPSFLVPTSLANESIISYSADSSSTTDATTEYIIEEIEEKPQEQEEEKDNGPRFYHRRRFWAMCIAITVVLSAIFIPLLFLVIIPNAAQSALNKSKIDFKSINITDPTNSSFIINMLGETTKAGSVSATVSFNGAVKILYNETLIGSVQLSPLKVSKGSGVVTGNNQVFTIEDLPTFNDFSSKILTENSFTWTLRGSANVHALGITTKNVKLDKEVEIPGSNGFITNVKDLKITQNQDKTLRIEAVTSIYNPSPIGIEIGVMHIQLGYEQSIITDTSINNITIAAGENDLPFVGNAQLPTSDQDRSNYIKIMNAYLTNKPLKTYAKVLSVLPKSGIPVEWLSKATEGLVLSAMVGNQTEPPQIIKNIDFGKVIIKFTPDAPYSPTISSTNATAGFDLPFKVPFKINTVSQNLTIFFKNHPVATLVAPETSAIGTDTNLILNVQETNMNVIKGSEENFSDLFTSLTTDKAAEIIIAGETNINVTTDILGNTLIQGLPLNVTTNLQGFNQFNSDGSAPTVSNLNVIAGTSNQLITGMIVTLTNPSQYSISVGKVSLDLFYKEQQIGTAVIDNLSVSPGANPVFVVSTINDPVKNSGIDLFTNLLSGQASTVNIRGSDNSTDIKSLVKSFKAINISSTIPPINQNFFTNAKVVIDNQTMAVKASVEISNNFNAPISIYTMNSSFSAFGITLGSLDQDLTKNPIFILGNSAVNVELPVTMSFDPVSLFSITRQAAIRNGLDVTVLDSLIALSNINVPGADPNAKPTPDAAKSFDLKTFITTALGKIPASFTANSHVAIGNYFMPMTYKQDIDVATDDSILLLVPMLSSQLINQAVDKTQVTTDTIFIKNIDVTSYDVFTVGQISNISPLAAQISFPTGVKISSNNVFLGVMYPQPISLAPLEGVQFNNSVAKFVIADIPSFTEYSGRMFNAESLTWDTEADIMVTTSGITMGPISMKKSIQLAGFNGLQQVTLKNFDPKFTSDGLNLNAEVEVTNPSNIGIELGKIVFNLYVQGKQISSVTSDVVINPKGISDLTFQGVIKPEDLQSILSTVGQNVPITVQGVSVTPPKATGDVPWLTIPTQKTIRNFPLNVNALEPPASAPPPSAPPQQ